jgi:DNA-binding winged helix-turn-helix (wHTH) protein/tetratricopeptide (TPR) repeat protein
LKLKEFYQFGPFRLEPGERRLSRDGNRIKLPPKEMELLIALVRAGGLCTWEELRGGVWRQEAFVEDQNLAVHISKLRNALGDSGEPEHKYIETVRGSGGGYRLILPVTRHAGAQDAEPVQSSAAPQAVSKRVVWLGVTFIIVGLVAYSTISLRNPALPQRNDPASGLYHRALDYERVGDDEQALATLDQAITLDPNYDEACVRAAYLAYELEEVPKATGYLKKCKAAQGQNEALRLKAQALQQLLADNGTRAMELYQLLIDRYPRDADALFRFAEAATERDRVEEADKATGMCLAIEPDNPYCRFQLMYVRLKQNRFNDVLADYQSLPASMRDYPWFDEPVGVALMGNGQLDQATKAFERLSGRQQRLHGTSHFTTGKEWVADVLLYQGRVADATRRIQQLMETSDNASARGSYLAYLARIYALLGDAQSARQFATETLTAPGEPDSLTVAAIVLANIGDSAGLERILKFRSETTAADLSPANEHLIHGLLAVAKGHTVKGIEEIRLTRDLNPHDEEATYWLGMAYIRAGDYQSALAMFQSVRDLKGTVLLDDVPLLVPLATYRIAQCQEHLGDANAAKNSYAEIAKVWVGADDSVPPKSAALKLRSK